MWFMEKVGFLCFRSFHLDFIYRLSQVENSYLIHQIIHKVTVDSKGRFAVPTKIEISLIGSADLVLTQTLG